jgi:Mg-chelatase subunit ChlD
MSQHLPKCMLGKDRRSRIAACWLGVLLAAGAIAPVPDAAAQAAPNPAAPAKIAISQVGSLGPDITLYLDVRAENGRFVRGVTAARLSATVAEHTATVGAVEPFDETPDGVLYLFLVDISKSLPPGEFAKIRQALSNWVNTLRPKDRVGLITFGAEVKTLVSPTADRATLRAAIDSLAPTDMNTALHQALAEAIELAAARRGADLPERRVIVTLTDGVDDAPEGFGSPGVLRELIAEAHVPIYAVGYATRSHDSAAVRAGLDALGEFAQRSGGGFIDARGTGDLPAAFSDLRQRIQEVYKIGLKCAACPLNGEPAPLLLTLKSDGFDLEDRIDVRLTPGPGPEPTTRPAVIPPELPPAEPSWFRQYWPFLAAAGAVLLLLLLWGLLLARRRKQAKVAEDDADDDLALGLSEGGAVPPPGSDLPAGAFDLGPAPLPVPPVPFQPQPQAPPPQPAAPYRGPTASISIAIIGGPRSGERLTLRLAPDAVIGRAPGCALSIGTDAEASGRHARIEVLDNGRIVLRDLDSTNGTRLNGISVQGAQRLGDGDVIGVGQSELRVGLGGRRYIKPATRRRSHGHQTRKRLVARAPRGTTGRLRLRRLRRRPAARPRRRADGARRRHGRHEQRPRGEPHRRRALHGRVPAEAAP